MLRELPLALSVENSLIFLRGFKDTFYGIVVLFCFVCYLQPLGALAMTISCYLSFCQNADLRSMLTMLLMFQCISYIGKRTISTVLECPSGYALPFIVVQAKLSVYLFLSVHFNLYFFGINYQGMVGISFCRILWQGSSLQFLENFLP